MRQGTPLAKGSEANDNQSVGMAQQNTGALTVSMASSAPLTAVAHVRGLCNIWGKVGETV